MLVRSILEVKKKTGLADRLMLIMSIISLSIVCGNFGGGAGGDGSPCACTAERRRRWVEAGRRVPIQGIGDVLQDKREADNRCVED
jgi:hypothetical protein